MPSDTMAVDITARARIPGTKKSTDLAVGVDTTSTEEKNTRKRTGIPTVKRRVSPRRRVMNTSARVWASKALIADPADPADPGDAGRRGDHGRVSRHPRRHRSRQCSTRSVAGPP